MITEHTDQQATTPRTHPTTRKGSTISTTGITHRRRSITNTAPHHHQHTGPPEGGPVTGSAAAPVLKMLASTIQFSNNNPHTPHTGRISSAAHPRRGAPGTSDNTPHHRPPPPGPPRRGTTGDRDREEEGPVVSGPNSAPWTPPPPDGTHRSTTTTPSPEGEDTLWRVLEKDPAGTWGAAACLLTFHP